MGIDPGVSGALAVVEDGVLTWATAMPSVKVRSKTRIVPSFLASLIAGEGPLDAAYVEEVGAMPGQGVSSMFAFGLATGLPVGILAGLGVPTSFLRPPEWRKLAGLISGTDKSASRARAASLWPTRSVLFLRAKDDGVAEAALIALAGYRREMGMFL